jgi:hypothetical protein
LGSGVSRSGLFGGGGEASGGWLTVGGGGGGEGLGVGVGVGVGAGVGVGRGVGLGLGLGSGRGVGEGPGEGEGEGLGEGEGPGEDCASGPISQSDESGEGGGEPRVWVDTTPDVSAIIARIAVTLDSRFTRTPPKHGGRAKEQEKRRQIQVLFV